jgi:mRNA-degrading endonuclease RelE of RelBE toxin-antitoxin system
VNSHVTKEFRRHLSDLPKEVQRQARKSYRLWRENHYYSSLQFKQVSQRQKIYSVRVGIGYRALGLISDDAVYWFWIGPHGEYDNLLKEL